jgi:trigger factor
MEIKETLAKGLKREFEVVSDSAAVEKEIASRLADYGNRVKIPGFRPGKIPQKVLAQRYGKDVEDDAVRAFMRNNAQKYITEKNLRNALPPKFTNLKFEPGKSISFKFSFELFPEVPTVDFTKIKLKKLKTEAGAKEIRNSLDRLASSRRKLNKVEEIRKAKLEDVVVINFRGLVDGEAIEGGTAENYRLELGSKQFIEGFEEGVVGMKPGEEKILNLKFPDPYGAKELAGKPVEFTVKLNEIHTVAKPEIDEDFAKQSGFESLAKLEEAVATQLNRDAEEMARTIAKRELFDHLEKSLDFEVPEEMLKIEYDSIWQRLQTARKQGDTSVAGKTDEQLKEEYTKIAKRRVRLGIFLSEIARNGQLKVTQEDLRGAIMKQARLFPGQENRIFELYRKNPQMLDELHGPIFEDKAVDYILDKAQLDEKAVSSE